MSRPAPRPRQGLPDWMVIARRELLERVRTWWFIAVTLLGPIGMIALIVVPAVLAAETGKEGVRVVVVDDAGPGTEFADAVKGELERFGWRAEIVAANTPPADLLRRIASDDIDGFLTLPPGLGEPVAGIPAVAMYQGDNATNQLVWLRMQSALSGAVLEVRLAARTEMSRDEIQRVVTLPVVAPRHTTGETSGTSGQAVFIVGYAVMIILYMAIVLYAVNVMRSVVQEKTNRVVEIMVAAAKPRALMLGKILGVGGAGLLQIAAWAAMAYLTLTFGVEGAGGWSLPPLGLDAFAVILAYFLLGYFFYASLYAAIGAMVSSDQEAQQAQTPVIMLLIVPMMCMQLVANDPRGGGAEILTILPFSSPILMPMRYLLDGAPPASVAISLTVLTLSTVLVAWLAGRIYRVGILLYGKRPSLRELARWIRHG